MRMRRNLIRVILILMISIYPICSYATGQDRYQQAHEDRANGGNGNSGSGSSQPTGQDRYQQAHEDRANGGNGNSGSGSSSSTSSQPTGQDRYQQAHEDRANGGNGNSGSGSSSGNGSTQNQGTGTTTVTRSSSSTSGGTIVDPIENPEEYKPSENASSNNTQLIERGNLVIGVIQLLGSAISVITFMVLGIRYMIGSVQEKALYKETLGPYLVGAVMIFAIPNIIAVLYNFIIGNLNVI